MMKMMATGRQKNSRGALVGLFRWARRMIENIGSRKKRAESVRVRLKNRLEGTVCRTHRVRRVLRRDRFVDMIIDRIAVTRRTRMRISKAQGGRRSNVRTSHVRRRRTRRRTQLKKIDIRSCCRARRRRVVRLRLRMFRRRCRGRGDGVRLLVIQMLHQTTLQHFLRKRRSRRLPVDDHWDWRRNARVSSLEWYRQDESIGSRGNTFLLRWIPRLFLGEDLQAFRTPSVFIGGQDQLQSIPFSHQRNTKRMCAGERQRSRRWKAIIILQIERKPHEQSGDQFSVPLCLTNLLPPHRSPRQKPNPCSGPPNTNNWHCSDIHQATTDWSDGDYCSNWNFKRNRHRQYSSLEASESEYRERRSKDLLSIVWSEMKRYVAPSEHFMNKLFSENHFTLRDTTAKFSDFMRIIHNTITVPMVLT